MDLGKLEKLAHERKCLVCGEKFVTDPTGYPTALVKFADHSTLHQATLGEWTTAYERIQASKTKEPISNKHTHKCRKCGRVWNCGLNAGTKDKPRCHWDENPDCVECPKKAVA